MAVSLCRSRPRAGTRRRWIAGEKAHRLPTSLAAARYYPHPGPFIRKIKNHVAFWHGVRAEVARDHSELGEYPPRRVWRAVCRGTRGLPINKTP